MVEPVLILDKVVTPVAALRDSTVLTVRYQWTIAREILVEMEELVSLKDLITSARVRLVLVVLAVIFSPKPAKKIHAGMEVSAQIQKTATSVLADMDILAKTANNKRTSAHQILARTRVLVYKREIVTSANVLLDFQGQNVKSTLTTAKETLA